MKFQIGLRNFVQFKDGTEHLLARLSETNLNLDVNSSNIFIFDIYVDMMNYFGIYYSKLTKTKHIY